MYGTAPVKMFASKNLRTRRRRTTVHNNNNLQLLQQCQSSQLSWERATEMISLDISMNEIAHNHNNAPFRTGRLRQSASQLSIVVCHSSCCCPTPNKLTRATTPARLRSSRSRHCRQDFLINRKRHCLQNHTRTQNLHLLHITTRIAC
jgi:hypothetical protein